eukprot:4742204-Amphidinium_carterae.1
MSGPQYSQEHIAKQTPILMLLVVGPIPVLLQWVRLYVNPQARGGSAFQQKPICLQRSQDMQSLQRLLSGSCLRLVVQPFCQQGRHKILFYLYLCQQSSIPSVIVVLWGLTGPIFCNACFTKKEGPRS